ncbi:hypothetical protein ACOME3_001723 [Neoechinorhynchus agilis]
MSESKRDSTLTMESNLSDQSELTVFDTEEFKHLLSELENCQQRCGEHLAAMSTEQQKMTVLIDIVASLNVLTEQFEYTEVDRVMRDKSIFLEYLTNLVNGLTSYFESPSMLNVDQFCTEIGIERLRPYFKPWRCKAKKQKLREHYGDELMAIKLQALRYKYQSSMLQSVEGTSQEGDSSVDKRLKVDLTDDNSSVRISIKNVSSIMTQGDSEPVTTEPTANNNGNVPRRRSALIRFFLRAFRFFFRNRRRNSRVVTQSTEPSQNLN